MPGILRYFIALQKILFFSVYFFLLHSALPISLYSSLYLSPFCCTFIGQPCNRSCSFSCGKNRAAGRWTWHAAQEWTLDKGLCHV